MRLILLPGLGGTGNLFAPLQRALGDRLESAVISYPVDRVLSYRELEDLVRERIGDAGPYVLLGESFSGPIAVRIAAERPPGLIGLVLVATFVEHPVGWWRFPARMVARRWFIRGRPPHFLFRSFLAGRDASDELVDECFAAVRSVAPEVLAARIRDALAVDATDALARVAVPILWLAAAHDRLLSNGTAKRAREIQPAMQYDSLDSPHLVLQRRPDEAAEMILRFVARCGDAGHVQDDSSS